MSYGKKDGTMWKLVAVCYGIGGSADSEWVVARFTSKAAADKYEVNARKQNISNLHDSPYLQTSLLRTADTSYIEEDAEFEVPVDPVI